MNDRPFPSSSAALPVAAVAAVTAALGLTFFYAPTEALQGEVQRIFYVHVPAAWIGYIAFFVVAAASVLVLVRRTDTEKWDRIAVSAAEVGLVFMTINIATGPIWGRRVWGVWWVWDARLTSALVLWLIYAGYLLFRSLQPPGEGRARLAAVIGIIGAVNIPVVHFAVVWWRTLHPEPTVLNPGGPQLPREMLLTLMGSFAALVVLFACLLAIRLRLERARNQLDARIGAASV